VLLLRRKPNLRNSQLFISDQTFHTNSTLKLTPSFQILKIRFNSITISKLHALKNMELPETDLSSSDNSRPKLTTMMVKLIKKASKLGLNHSKSQLSSYSPKTRLKLSLDNNKILLSYSELKLMKMLIS
jgi:hypothetical protein